MMLFKLSLKNIKKSLKDYAIYFFTLILGVAIFYVFNAIDSQTVMLNVSNSTYDIIKLMTTILSGVSVFVSFILAFLIIYASRFLIKRRNKEFAIYLSLGMSKKKISFILLVETLIIGFLSLGVGLVLGFILSQLMSVLVANMFAADMTNFQFVFSSSAAVKTLIYFSIMYLIVMIFNTVSISKCKLIDLLQANKKMEQIKFKNPVLSVIVFLGACITLGFAYYMVTGGIEKYLQNVSYALIPITLGCVSTFLIFWSLSGLLLKIFKSIKKIYYKGLNSFTLRQFASKINTTVFSMTIICLMLFITICVLSSTLSMKNSMATNLKTLAPADIEIYKDLNLTDTNKYTDAKIADSKESLISTLEKMNFSVTDNFSDMVIFDTYSTNTLKIRDTLGAYYEESLSKYPYLLYDMTETIMKISDYNKMAKFFNLPSFTLNDDEYLVVANYKDWINIRNSALALKTEITLGEKTLHPKYLECQNGFYEMNASYASLGLIVVPDDMVSNLTAKKEYLVANYKGSTETEKRQIEEKITALDNEDYVRNTTLEVRSKIYIAEASVGLGAMVTFIGLYLGIIFLISCAAMLALKELSESSDNTSKFNMLRRIGVDEAMLNKALFRQIAIFFMFPLILAIIHSIFGIKFCNFILASIGNDNLLSSIIMTAVFIVIIYGGYFLVTYLCSKNIIKESR